MTLRIVLGLALWTAAASALPAAAGSVGPDLVARAHHTCPLVVYPSKLPGSYHLNTASPFGCSYVLETTSDPTTVANWYTSHVSGLTLTSHTSNELGEGYIYEKHDASGAWDIQVQRQHGEQTEVSYAVTWGA